MQCRLCSGFWSPILVGGLIGILSWATFLGMSKALGVSTCFVHLAAGIEQVGAPIHAAENAYFEKTLSGKALIDWQALLVVGLMLGAWIGSRLDRAAVPPSLPSAWRARFGDRNATRFVGAFFGGALLLFGARMAGGCTSGHGISGGLQLAVSSWIFIAAAFGVGIPAAFMLYRTTPNNTIVADTTLDNKGESV